MTMRVLYLPRFLPTSLNKSVGRHWAVKARQKKADLEIVQFEARRQGFDVCQTAKRVSLRLVLPKGQRAFDPDNLLKALLDCLKHAGLIVNDSPKWCQIGSIEYVRHAGELRETYVILEDVDP